MENKHLSLQGLSDSEVLESRQKHGRNEFITEKRSGFLIAITGLFKEPMFLMLLVASTIYFISGEISDGIFMLVAIVMVSAISLYQDAKSRNALDALKTLTRPNCTVIRNGQNQEIKREEIVVGDRIIIQEGASIPADAEIIKSNDFSVNESILTGESFAVFKSEEADDKMVYAGTTVSGGLAICRVVSIGSETKLGKIGRSLEVIKEEATPLQIQINNFVKKMVIIGTIVFLIVWALNYFRSYSVLDSLLKALTLAMSIIPEEIPVTFATFMALGAWRLMKTGIIVKQTKTVEALGSATVICVDKTGTITENRMSIAKLFVLSGEKFSDPHDVMGIAEKELIRYGMWSSEPIPFDPMEIALHSEYGRQHETDERINFKLVHEYPLSGKPPMMTHVFENQSGHRIIAAKGAPEALIAVSDLSPEEIGKITDAVNVMASMGFRILGVGVTLFDGKNYPEQQQHFKFIFKGLIAFYDPPKENIARVFEAFYKAGINVKIVTGDNTATTLSIANQVGFKGAGNSLTGDELIKMSQKELEEKTETINIFTRMYPEAKLKIVNALKARGQIVAMTGDGVNDAPALKAAHIGIGMGKKGSEIAKQASSLILIDDDLARMVDAVAMGRKIYTNIKKAIQYVISIHIPIILTVFIPLVLGWMYPNIFSPVHIIFLEMIMGPTCSIIYENEPMEENTMLQKPRPFINTFFNWGELTTSIMQGLMITVGTLFTYQFAVANNCDESTTRTMIFIVLITANIFLTLVNRSFYYSIITTAHYKNNLVLLIIALTIMLSACLLFINPVTDFFQFSKIEAVFFIFSVLVGLVSVIWFEVVKWYWRRSSKAQS